MWYHRIKIEIPFVCSECTNNTQKFEMMKQTHADTLVYCRHSDLPCVVLSSRSNRWSVISKEDQICDKVKNITVCYIKGLLFLCEHKNSII